VLRLNLGDLIEWEGAEYTVAATDPMATLLVRLADGRRIWVDLPSLAAAGDVSLRPIAGRTAGDGVGAGGPPLTGPEAERALWWQAHLNEVIHGVPNPDDASLTPRPGYEQASKTGRREVKARELHAAGVTVSTRTLRRKEAAYIRGGLRGLLDHREDNRRTTEVDVRVTDAVLAVYERAAAGMALDTRRLGAGVSPGLHPQLCAESDRDHKRRTQVRRPLFVGL
jgi:putative transposase